MLFKERSIECPRCGSPEVERIPRNQIDPFRRYLCVNCGVKMRTCGSLFPYLVVLMLGLAIFAMFVYLALGFEGEQRMSIGSFGLAGLGLVCAAYSLVQIMRPIPVRNKPDKLLE